MKRKDYIRPSIEIIQFEGEILAASVGVETGDGLGNDFDENDETFSNKRDYWGENEWQ